MKVILLALPWPSTPARTLFSRAAGCSDLRICKSSFNLSCFFSACHPQVSSTAYNEDSSRSHTVCRLVVEGRPEESAAASGANSGRNSGRVTPSGGLGKSVCVKDYYPT
jgi:hypothetical protein